MKFDYSPAPKRCRSTAIHLMDSELVKNAIQHKNLLLPGDLSYEQSDVVTRHAKLAAAREKFGREIRVFETSTSSMPTNVTNSEEDEEFYEFTAEDYYRLMASRKEDKFLKTRKIREAEEAARRSKMTKAVIRVRFPDNYTLETVFHPSDTLQSLVDLLVNVINHPEVPFYIYTTPPKKKIRDTVQDFYSAGFVPGAIVYFAYDQQEGIDYHAVSSEQFLKEEVMALKGLELIPEQAESVQPAQPPLLSSQTDAGAQEPSVPDRKASDKKNIKPKWLKM